MIGSLIPVLAPILNKIIGAVIPGKDQKAKIESEIMKQLLLHQGEIDKSASDIIKIEASSKSWLSSNWRPLTMIVLVFYVGVYLFGFASEKMTEEVFMKFLQLLQYGLTGYITGRSAEKILPNAIESYCKHKQRKKDE